MSKDPEKFMAVAKLEMTLGLAVKYRKKFGANMLLERVKENWNHYLLLFSLFNR
jgi:hypothetical protein